VTGKPPISGFLAIERRSVPKFCERPYNAWPVAMALSPAAPDVSAKARLPSSHAFCNPDLVAGESPRLHQPLMRGDVEDGKTVCLEAVNRQSPQDRVPEGFLSRSSADQKIGVASKARLRPAKRAPQNVDYIKSWSNWARLTRTIPEAPEIPQRPELERTVALHPGHAQAAAGLPKAAFQMCQSPGLGQAPPCTSRN